MHMRPIIRDNSNNNNSGRDTGRPVFGGSDQKRLIPVCSTSVFQRRHKCVVTFVCYAGNKCSIEAAQMSIRVSELFLIVYQSRNGQIRWFLQQDPGVVGSFHAQFG